MFLYIYLSLRTKKIKIYLISFCYFFRKFFQSYLKEKPLLLRYNDFFYNQFS